MPHNILAGKKGIIFGALDDKSLAWHVAEAAHAEGAQIVLTNAPVAMRFGKINELSEKINAPVITADATVNQDLETLVDQSMEHLGGKLDFILHSIGMSVNVRKENPYYNLNHDFMHKTFDVSAMSFHRMCQTLYNRDAMNDWGSIVALTYIAAQRVFPDYSEMADAKALLESFVRSFGYYFGRKNKVRINSISQSPTLTTAGSGVKGFEDFQRYADKLSPLGNASANDFAQYCVALFSDYTRMVTMQNLFHDGGFSFMGANPEVVPVS